MRVAVLGVAALVSIACDAKPHSALATLTEVPVVAPFGGLKLPTSEGRIWVCTGPAALRKPATMRVAYDGGDKPALGWKYGTAVMRAGWTKRDPPSVTPERWSMLFDDPDDERTLILQLTDSTFDGRVPHGVDVSITIMIARPR